MPPLKLGAFHVGLPEELDRCAEMALRDMIHWIVQRTGMGREDAYMLCSLAGDLRITQTVSGNKGAERANLAPNSLSS